MTAEKQPPLCREVRHKQVTDRQTKLPSVHLSDTWEKIDRDGAEGRRDGVQAGGEIQETKRLPLSVCSFLFKHRAPLTKVSADPCFHTVGCSSRDFPEMLWMWSFSFCLLCAVGGFKHGPFLHGSSNASNLSFYDFMSVTQTSRTVNIDKEETNQ